MILERGALLNQRYRIVEILGQGGMGSVYRAVDENLGVEVAVKDNLFTTEEYARQFRREAVILANLRHPNLPRVTDHFVIEGQGQYLVMDYIEGEDLRQRMDRIGVLNETEAIVIGSAICDALTYLSTRNPPIIHRDIKPGNVKISPQGQIFLVDFGLAKVLQGSQATTTGARAMTPGYSPPEQYGTARTDTRSDIFSLGATLYASLTGEIPEDALSRAMEQTGLTPIRKQNSRISKRLASVIEKSLAVRPDDRYQTAEDFKQALQGALSTTRRRMGEIIVAPPPNFQSRPFSADGEIPVSPVTPIPERLSRPNDYSPLPLPVSSPILEQQGYYSQESKPAPRRMGQGCWTVLLVAALLLVIGSLVAYIYDPPFISNLKAIILPLPTQTSAPTREPVVLPTETLAAIQLPTQDLRPLVSPTPKIPPTVVKSSTPTPLSTPGPTTIPTPLPTLMGGGAGEIAYAYDKTGVPQIYITNIAGTQKHQVTDLSEGACQPAWSPDGQRLVFISPCQGNVDSYPNSGLFIVNADGGDQKALLPNMPGGDYDPAWSPDGTRIAFTTLRDGNRPRIYVYDFRDNSVTQLSDSGPEARYARESQPAWSPDGKKIAYLTNRQGPSQIWVMNADGTNPEIFSHSANWIDSHPNWSADGKLILFTQVTVAGGIPRLVVSPYLDPSKPNDSNYKESTISQDKMIPMRDGRYSPDGFWIALEAWPAGGNHDIYIMATNGVGLQPITTELRDQFNPAWRPLVR